MIFCIKKDKFFIIAVVSRNVYYPFVVNLWTCHKNREPDHQRKKKKKETEISGVRKEMTGK